MNEDRTCAQADPKLTQPRSGDVRYWVSWWSGNYADEGCTKPPFKFWSSGSRYRAEDDERDECSLCAVIDAADDLDVWRLVKQHFPDCEERFCDEKELGWKPGDRFR
jgi:hypothetical protein